MQLLLDTHCLLWLLLDSPALTPPMRAKITSAESVWLSDASVWEIALKWRKGKIKAQPRRIVDQALSNGLRTLPITQEALLLSCELQQDHADPFDRLLYAQAAHAKMPLMTIDRTLAGFGAMIVKL